MITLPPSITLSDTLFPYPALIRSVNETRCDRALNLLISGSGEIAAVIAFEHDQILRRGGCGEKQLGGGRQSSWATGDDPVEHGLIGFCRIAHHFEAVAIGLHLRALTDGGFRADKEHGGMGGGWLRFLC